PSAPDPLGGSHYLEALTDRLEADARRYLERIDALGGAVAAIEAGYQQGEIEQAAYATAQAIDRREQVVVGVNRFVDDAGAPSVAALPVDPELARRQTERVARLRAGRDAAAVARALASVAQTAQGDANLLPPIKHALRAGATLGEVSDALRQVFGLVD